jgi:hypothetical protein
MEAAPMTKIGEEQPPVTFPATIAEESKEPLPKFQFSCKKCRKVLFSEDNLEEHMSQVKAYNTKSHNVRVGVPYTELCS